MRSAYKAGQIPKKTEKEKNQKSRLINQKEYEIMTQEERKLELNKLDAIESNDKSSLERVDAADVAILAIII